MRRRLIVAVAGLIGLVPAMAEPDPRRSGFDEMGPATQAMQRDAAANPGMVWVLAGEELWRRAAPGGGPSCAGCHGEAGTSMRGVAARYPAFDAAEGRPIDLQGRVNLCRTARQKAPAFAAEGRELLALTTLVAHQSRGLPIAPPDDPRLAPARERGRALFSRRVGQLDLSCAQCHDERAGGRLAGNPIPQAHPTRLSALPARMAEPRLAAAPAAQLPDGRARRALPVWRAGICRARALPDEPRRRHDGRDARRASLIVSAPCPECCGTK